MGMAESTVSTVINQGTNHSVTSVFRRPTHKEIFYLALVAVLYALGVGYAYYHHLSLEALFYYGLLQPSGVTGEAARLTEINTPLSWNLLQVGWFILVKGAAVLVELFQYWIVGSVDRQRAGGVCVVGESQTEDGLWGREG